MSNTKASNKSLSESCIDCEICGNSDLPVMVVSSGIGAMSLRTCHICSGVDAEQPGLEDAVGFQYVTYDKDTDRYLDATVDKNPILLNTSLGKFETRAELVNVIKEKDNA